MMMRGDYVPYLLASSSVFDSPARIDDYSTRFDIGIDTISNGWRRFEHGLYVGMEVVAQQLPEQGWKMHVSANPGNSADVLGIVANYCAETQVAYKYLRSKTALHMINSKTWDRSSSGKFITLYPLDTGLFERCLFDLNELLRGFKGPYVLTDIRYARGPLFARYGAFRPRWVKSDYGEMVPAIRNPNGDLEPDVRSIPFACPSFIQIPPSLQVYAEKTGQVPVMPYHFDAALKYSNSGGTYLGRLHDNPEPVILKEARPWAGLDNKGDDAIIRLNNEASALEALSHLDCVPKVLGRAKIWEHDYIALEHVAGRTLLSEVISRYPLVHPTPDELEVDAYVEWVNSIFLKIEAALFKVHDNGVSIGDIHPSNVILRSDGDPVFIDLECASQLNGERVIRMAAEGYSLKDVDASPRDADLHSLNTLLLMMLMPIMPIMGLDRSKASTIIKAAKTHLGLHGKLKQRLEKAFDNEGVTDQGARIVATEPWSEVRTAIAKSILSEASPERSDRLFAGDPSQFSGDAAVGLAFGAAGVLFALGRAEMSIPPPLVDWTISASSKCQASGLYDGALGAAVVLEELGFQDNAHELAEKHLNTANLNDNDLTLFSGAAGIGLSALHFDTSMSRSMFLDVGLLAGRKVMEGLSKTRAGLGLFRGLTGSALLLIHLYEATGSGTFLDSAQDALEREIAAGRILDDGVFHLHTNNKYLIYLDGGSVGLGMVLERFLRHRPSSHMRTILSAIQRGCSIPFVMQPGLFQGRAGLIAALCHSAGERDADVVEDQARRLSWHAIKTLEGVAFPGSGLSRLSFDLATGSSGVLLAITAIDKSHGSFLPFL